MFNYLHIFSDIKMTNAAPSEVCDAFPAVTVPFCANTDLYLLSASTEPPFLGPSSVSTINSLSCLFSFESK